MRPLLIILALIWSIGVIRAESPTGKAEEEMGNLQGMSVIQLREQSCGGRGAEGHQEFKNAKFVGCEMFVLGVVEMLREWQKLDPSHAPNVCVPRNISSGALIIVVHDYIEKTMPWRNQQNDATTSIIGAFKDKWPCS